MPANNVPLLTLVVHVPGGEDRRIDIDEWRTVIGRSSNNDIKLVSKQVSKIHAAIEVNDGDAYVRDLGSRNGVEVNGYPVKRSRRLEPGDVITMGDASMTVDPQSFVFRPAQSQDALQKLLDEEAALRSRDEDTTEQDRRRPSHSGFTVNEAVQDTRQAAVLIGRPVATASGDVPVLRRLRITDDLGPRNESRIEPFIMELERGERVWIRPQGDVSVSDVDRFPSAPNVWIDEPEDFADVRQTAVLQRTTYYLPNRLKVVGAVETKPHEGMRVFTESSGVEPLGFTPAD